MPLWLRRLTFTKMKEFYDAREKSQNPKEAGEIDMANPDKSQLPTKRTVTPPSYVAKKLKK